MEYPQIVYAAAILIMSCTCLLMKKNGKRRWWVRPWVLRRDTKGAFSLVNEEFEACDDHESFKNLFRMDRVTFSKMLSLIESEIVKQSTLLRQAVSPRERLIITLRFLATGESFKSLHYNFRLGVSTISNITLDVCTAIRRVLMPIYVKTPTTPAEWLNIAEEFLNKWNFPHTLGAKYGKHIVFKAPTSAGSAYYNYKHENSIVLFAVVDADYKFLYIDCGTNGRVSDGGVYQKSTLCQAINSNLLNFPEDCPLTAGRRPVYVFVADAAFPLQMHIMKPFPFRNMTWYQRIFNYRLSRARRVVENAFGILANRWRVLLTTINLSAEKTQLITETCCILHNFLAVECPRDDIEMKYTFIYGLAHQGGNRARHDNIDSRNEFMRFVNEEGALPWQANYA